eukprot:scaffold365291_cov33-Prasinocladus_malaysianus.AAC.1
MDWFLDAQSPAQHLEQLWVPARPIDPHGLSPMRECTAPKPSSGKASETSRAISAVHAMQRAALD